MKKDPLYEVIFDVAINLDRYLNNLVEDERDAIMDGLEGSRGLCHSCVIPWAHEFEKTWTERGDEDIDNIIAVDEFTQKKFDELRASALPDVKSIQVVPVIERFENDKRYFEPQFGGPTTETTGWAVYERGRNDLARWAADFGKEGDAQRFGAMLSHQYGVPFEPQPWKAPKKQAEIVRELVPTTFRVSWEIDVDALTARDAAMKAREIQLKADSDALVFDVKGSQLGDEVRIDLGEAQ